MKNIAIIPARSGSKGLVHKNIKLLEGKPLMAYTIEAARKTKLFDEIMVSTDSEVYASIAKKYGANVPFLRNETLSSDTANSWDVVKSVLETYKKNGKQFDTICLLQPTSPLRREGDIKAGYRLLKERNAQAITSVCEMDHSPLWSMVLPANHSLYEYRQNANYSGNRQQFETYYRLNGAIYIRKIVYVEDKPELLETDEYALIMDPVNSVDIDTELDFLVAETIMKNNINQDCG